jgi:hypothetical protein
MRRRARLPPVQSLIADLAAGIGAILHRMKTYALRMAASALVASALAAAAAAEGFKLYPGAVRYTPPDTEQNRKFTETLRPGLKIDAYFTKDPFDKVLAFYKGLGREYTNPKAQQNARLPDGQQIQRAFLILDGAPNLESSRSWVRIQHPFTGRVSFKDGTPQYGDVRDVTEIVLRQMEKVETPKRQ